MKSRKELRKELIRIAKSGDESSKIEIKSTLDVEHEGGLAEFIRDVIALANADPDPNGREVGWLIVGAIRDGKLRDIGGLQLQKRTHSLQQQLEKYISPALELNYYEFDNGKKGRIGVFQIPLSGDRPFIVRKTMPARDQKGQTITAPDGEKLHRLHKGQTWVRHGSTKGGGATKEDIDRIYGRKFETQLSSVIENLQPPSRKNLAPSARIGRGAKLPDVPPPSSYSRLVPEERRWRMMADLWLWAEQRGRQLRVPPRWSLRGHEAGYLLIRVGPSLRRVVFTPWPGSVARKDLWPTMDRAIQVAYLIKTVLDPQQASRIVPEWSRRVRPSNRDEQRELAEFARPWRRAGTEYEYVSCVLAFGKLSPATLRKAANGMGKVHFDMPFGYYLGPSLDKPWPNGHIGVWPTIFCTNIENGAALAEAAEQALEWIKRNLKIEIH